MRVVITGGTGLIGSALARRGGQPADPLDPADPVAIVSGRCADSENSELASSPRVSPCSP